MSRRKDLTGKKYGKLLVLSRGPNAEEAEGWDPEGYGAKFSKKCFG